MSYIWQSPKQIDEEILEKFPELHPIVVQLLYNRGLDSQIKIDEFLYPDYSRDVYDPYLFRDMAKACARIDSAIENKEKITVYGDYDADGVCSSVILETVLKKVGAIVEVYLPHREKDGYGLNKNSVKEIIDNGTSLIITCDCGISNVDEVAFANENKTDVIITDHHSIPETLPKALAIIHPKIEGEEYPFKFLAGGGVAFKLAQALLKKNEKLQDKEKEIEEKWLLDLVAISTVADMVPLLGENRTLVKYGLLVLKKSKHLGLKKLLEIANIDVNKIDAQTISFSVGPRINAAGRMDHANLAYYMLMEEDEERATQLASDLNQSNLDRQKLTDQVVREAKQMDIDSADRLLTFYKEDWPAGLTGLVAGRLLRDYGKPCIVMTKVADQIIGSSRSVNGFNITAALTENKHLINRFGGHPQAAGFAIKEENKEELMANLKKIALEQLKDIDLTPKIDIELEVDFEDINWELVDLLDKFSPFGQENPEPLFMSKGLKITLARKVGIDQKHWKLELSKGNKAKGAIAFGLTNIDLAVGDSVDVVYNLSINQWNGNREIQLIIRDIKKNA